MPELPEVETMCRGILAVQGSRIRSAQAVACRLKPIAISPSPVEIRRRLPGRFIQAIERLGKRVVLELDTRDRLVFEPRMTGLVLLADPPDREHLRFRLNLDQGPHPVLWFWDRRGLGNVTLYTAEQYQNRFGPDVLGPDPLTISRQELQKRLQASRRPIKVALLDQRALAGVGNLYAAEILHAAGIHPATPCHQLTEEQWQRCHRALRRILKQAIRYEGSTLGDGTYRNALNQNGTYQNHHRVYARAGQRCSTCRQATIVRIVQAQRATFYCPACQGE